jgi:hypothetical protein
MPSPRRSRRLVCAAGSALAALGLIALPAAAQPAREHCPPAPTSKPFLPWLDPADYVVAPAGDLEGAGSWARSGGASIVAGNEPFYVGSPRDRASLRLSAGSSAATEPMCVGIEHPTVRFLAKRESLSPLGLLLVEALFTDEGSDVHAVPIGTVVGLGTWAPTAPLAILVNSLALTNDTVQVTFRFTPLNGSEWSIDDVYVDPYRTN